MQPKQPIKPGTLCYVKTPKPWSELSGRIVIAIRLDMGEPYQLPNGVILQKSSTARCWWIKSATDGETLPWRGLQVPERTVFECLLYPITPPAGTLETETTKWLEELYEQQI